MTNSPKKNLLSITLREETADNDTFMIQPEVSILRNTLDMDVPYMDTPTPMLEQKGAEGRNRIPLRF